MVLSVPECEACDGAFSWGWSRTAINRRLLIQGYLTLHYMHDKQGVAVVHSSDATATLMGSRHYSIGAKCFPDLKVRSQPHCMCHVYIV